MRRPFSATALGLWSRWRACDNRNRERHGKERHCRILKPCILAVRSLPSFGGLPSAMTGLNQDNARPRQGLGELTHRDGSDGTIGSNGTSTRLNDERDWRAG